VCDILEQGTEHWIQPAINVHNSSSVDPVPNCMKPVHTSVPVSLTFILILSPLLWLGLPSSVLHSRSLNTILHTFSSFPCRGRNSIRLIHLHMINLPLFKEYELWSFSLYNHLHPGSPPPPPGFKRSPQYLVCLHPPICPSFDMRDNFLHRYTTRVTIKITVCFDVYIYRCPTGWTNTWFWSLYLFVVFNYSVIVFNVTTRRKRRSISFQLRS